MKILIPYLLLINASAFLLMLADKRRAVKKAWRIPEATLIGVAAIGGSLGAVLGMRIFRHKTRHLKFSLGLPAILVLHMLILTYLYIKTA